MNEKSMSIYETQGRNWSFWFIRSQTTVYLQTDDSLQNLETILEKDYPTFSVFLGLFLKARTIFLHQKTDTGLEVPWSAPNCLTYHVIILEKSCNFNMLSAKLASEWDKEYINLNVVTTFPIIEKKVTAIFMNMLGCFCWLLGCVFCNTQYFDFLHERL